MSRMPKALRYTMMRDTGRDGYGNGRSDTRRDTRNNTDIEIDARYPMMNNYEAKFRDRRGREHYDNGRFAPMRSEYNAAYEKRYADDRHHEGERHMEEPRNHYPSYMPPYYENERYGREDNAGMRRVMGFAGGNMHYDGPSYANEMEHKTAPMERGYGYGESIKPLDKATAHEWTRQMHNEDGSTGEHWNMDQTSSVMQKRGYGHDPIEWYAVMNAMYSDYYNVAKKHGLAGSVDFFADLANSWLSDKDAVDDKAAVYFAKIVKH